MVAGVAHDERAILVAPNVLQSDENGRVLVAARAERLVGRRGPTLLIAKDLEVDVAFGNNASEEN